MSTEEGENGLTLEKFWSFYFHPLILRNCGEIWVLSHFCFFLKMTYILMDRFTMEILGCGMIGDYLSKVDINTRSR
jgi:hypothetical protein